MFIIVITVIEYFRHGIKLLSILSITWRSGRATMKYGIVIHLMWLRLFLETRCSERVWCILPNIILMHTTDASTRRYIGQIGGGKSRYISNTLVFPGTWKYLSLIITRMLALQQDLPLGAIVIPIIFRIDQTHLNNLGRAKAYPLYITIGNILKSACRKHKNHAYVLLGYFPILRTNKNRPSNANTTEAWHVLYHLCMSVIMERLHKASVRYCTYVLPCVSIQYICFIKPFIPCTEVLHWKVPMVLRVSATQYWLHFRWTTLKLVRSRWYDQCIPVRYA